MPRFYFHLHNDLDVPDEEGADFPDLEAARAHAFQQARILIGETTKEHGRIVLHHRIDIEDERHAVQGTVWFSDVITVEQ